MPQSNVRSASNAKVVGWRAIIVPAHGGQEYERHIGHNKLRKFITIGTLYEKL